MKKATTLFAGAVLCLWALAFTACPQDTDDQNLNPVVSVTITGTATVGQTLTAAAKDGSGAAVTAKYQWQRADSDSGAFADIPGAAQATYQIQTADVEKYLRVTATNSATASPVASPATAQVTAAGTDPGGSASGVDYTDYTSNYAFKLRNDTKEKLVVFKSSIEAANLLGGVKPQTTQGIKNNAAIFGNKSSDFTLYFITEADYLAYKDTPTQLRALESQCFTRIWAFYNATGTNDYPYTISGKLGGAGKIVLQNQTKLNMELRLNGPDGETIGYARAGAVNTTLSLDTGPYTIFPVFKKYDSLHDRVITIYPVYPDTWEDADLRGVARSKSLTVTTNEKQISASEFQADLNAAFSTGSAWLIIDNQYGDGIKVLKGDEVQYDETLDTNILDNAESRTYGVAMAQVGSKYAATANVSAWKAGKEGVEKTLKDNLVKADGTTPEDNAVLNLACDHMYKVTMLSSGKFKWDGDQGTVTLDDLLETSSTD